MTRRPVEPTAPSVLDVEDVAHRRLVWCAEGPYEPGAALVRYLRDHPPTASAPVHLVFGVRRTPPPPVILAMDHITFGTTMPGRGLSGVPDLAYHRLSYHEVSRAVLDKRVEISGFIACGSQTAPATYSLGAINGYMSNLVASATDVYIEEVPWLPHVRGATVVREPTSVTPTTRQPGDVGPGFSQAHPDDLDRRVAEWTAQCIPRGATISLGIGRITQALGAALMDRRDLEYVGGVVQDSVRELERVGVFGRRMLRSTSVVGGDDLLRWAASNPRLHLEPSTSVHNPEWLSSLPRFTAILSGVEIDLTGAVNSEVSRGRLLSGVGGAPDFAAGGMISPGGRTVIVMRSRRRDGSSALVSELPSESIPGDHVSHVVTEHGTADLRDVLPADRAPILRELFRIER